MKRKIISILLILTIFLCSIIPASAVCFQLGRYRICFGTKTTLQTTAKTTTKTANNTTTCTQGNCSAPKQATADSVTQKIPSGNILEYERQVVTLVNQERAKYGLSALSIREDLCIGARRKSQDMQTSRYFSHTSPNYGSPFEMMKSFGITYRSAGENIAMGYATPQAVVTAWMNSSGHRANILSSSFTSIGVGYVASGHYWTQWFVG